MSVDKPEELDVKSKASLFGERATFKKTADPIERSGATSPRFREVVKQQEQGSKPSPSNSTTGLSSSGSANKKPTQESSSTNATTTTANKPALGRIPSYPSSAAAKSEPSQESSPVSPKPSATATTEVLFPFHSMPGENFMRIVFHCIVWCCCFTSFYLLV
jgi:hypothetical protein